MSNAIESLRSAQQRAMAAWKAGVVSYDVDFEARTCTYYGVGRETYVEAYAVVEVG